jgi:hypothetical protein
MAEVIGLHLASPQQPAVFFTGREATAQLLQSRGVIGPIALC